MQRSMERMSTAQGQRVERRMTAVVVQARRRGWAWLLLLGLGVMAAEARGAAIPTWNVEHGLVCEGPIQDAKCDVDAVEHANDQELHGWGPHSCMFARFPEFDWF